MSSCDTYRNILKQAVEQKTALSSDTLLHFKSCESPQCQAEFFDFQLLEAAISAWKQNLPKVDLVDRIVGSGTTLLPSQHATNVESPPPFTKVSAAATRPSSMTALGVVAAALSLCLLVMITRSSNPVNSEGFQGPSINELAQAAPQQDGGPPTVEAAELESELKEFGKLTGSWVQGAASKLSGTMTVVLLNQETPTEETSSSWFSEFTEQIEPLESKLDATLKLLRDSISKSPDDATETRQFNQNEYFGFA